MIHLPAILARGTQTAVLKITSQFCLTGVSKLELSGYNWLPLLNVDNLQPSALIICIFGDFGEA